MSRPGPARRGVVVVYYHQMKHSIYKYFTAAIHAQQFLDGQLLFRSLAYFRDLEDAVRGDEYEGTSKFLPEGGLVVHNETQGTTGIVPMAFESSVQAPDIFVCCLSRTLSAEIGRSLNAVACVEVTKIATLCSRCEAALPPAATFKARAVEYYLQAQGGSPRWALPGEIATSKLERWAYQNEYRLVFSLSDALGFQNVELRLIERKNRPPAKPEEHHSRLLTVHSLRDICVWHDCKTL